MYVDAIIVIFLHNGKSNTCSGFHEMFIKNTKLLGKCLYSKKCLHATVASEADSSDRSGLGFDFEIPPSVCIL